MDADKQVIALRKQPGAGLSRRTCFVVRDEGRPTYEWRAKIRAVSARAARCIDTPLDAAWMFTLTEVVPQVRADDGMPQELACSNKRTWAGSSRLSLKKRHCAPERQEKTRQVCCGRAEGPRRLLRTDRLYRSY